MNARQFSVAMLFALILLTLASAPWSGQQESGAYDPWLDYNEDGVIDVNELHQIAEVYGSSGEPTRNVTVSRHVTSYIRPSGASNISIPASGDWLSEMITIDGYAKVTVMIKASIAGFTNLDLYACDNDGREWWIERAIQTNSNWVKTYDVMSQRIRVKIHNADTSTITVDVALYLMA